MIAATVASLPLSPDGVLGVSVTAEDAALLPVAGDTRLRPEVAGVRGASGDAALKDTARARG